MTKYLVVGLGNPGPSYTYTRHNIGYMVLDHLAQGGQVSFCQERFAETAQCTWRGRRLCLIKPTTYMNHSGKAVRYWMDRLRIAPTCILVVVDDLSLPFGRLRLRPSGSSAGHNGLRSVEAALATPAYPRLRVGIGASFAKGKQADFVLSAFSSDQAAALPGIFSAASEVVKVCATAGVTVAMNRYNGSAHLRAADEA